MNSYINSQYDTSLERRKKLEYRNILQKQIKQKQSLKNQGRFKTQNKNTPYNSSRFQSLQNNRQNNSSNRSSKTKKIQQQSGFLPRVFKHKKKFSDGRYGLGNPQNNGYSYDIGERAQGFNADIQTIEALTQCQIIIQNLRKLRISSLNSIKRKMKFNTLDISSPSNHQNYTERYPNSPKQKQSSADQQVRMFQPWNPSTKLNQDKHNSLKKSRQKQQNKKDNLLFQEDAGQQNLQYSPQENQIQNDQQNSQRQFKQNSVCLQQNQQENSVCLQQNKQEQQQLKAQKQQEKARKRQKYLLKYLGKAKIRGTKLHQKILQFKNRSLVQQNKQKQSSVQSQQQKKASQLSNKKYKNTQQKLNATDQDEDQ